MYNFGKSNPLSPLSRIMLIDRLTKKEKKHPEHVFPGMKFTSLNKYSSGISHPKQVFCFFLS